MDVDSLAPEVDPEAQMQIRYKPEETPVTLSRQENLSRTRVPELGLVSGNRNRTAGERSGDNARAAYVVRFRDLRYDYPGRNGRAILGAKVS